MKSMISLFLQLFTTGCVLILLSTFSFSAEKKPAQLAKNPEIQQVKPKKPVKIKLKRSAEGRYTWELSGDDADEIVKADKRLRKLLGAE